MAFAAGWRSSTRGPGPAWSWIDGSSSRPTACVRTRFAWRAATPRPTRIATRRRREADMDWQAMTALGAYHGLNPGMGWLFAVALGMQQGSARGVWRALPPIAFGHFIAVGAVLVATALLELVIPVSTLKVL